MLQVHSTYTLIYYYNFVRNQPSPQAAWFSSHSTSRKYNLQFMIHDICTCTYVLCMYSCIKHTLLFQLHTLLSFCPNWTLKWRTFSIFLYAYFSVHNGRWALGVSRGKADSVICYFLQSHLSWLFGPLLAFWIWNEFKFLMLFPSSYMATLYNHTTYPKSLFQPMSGKVKLIMKTHLFTVLFPCCVCT
jgi:hypothetical protein